MADGKEFLIHGAEQWAAPMVRAHKVRPRCERERLERWAAAGDRIAAYMLEHGVGFPEAIEALARRLPRPAVIYNIRDYQPPEDP
jgi:hypothetical protein